MIDEKILSSIMSELGKKGGSKTAGRGSDFYRKLQKKSVKSRLKNKKKLSTV